MNEVFADIPAFHRVRTRHLYTDTTNTTHTSPDTIHGTKPANMDRGAP